MRDDCFHFGANVSAGSSMHPGGLRLTVRAARLAGIADGMRVADIGCGNGATLRCLKFLYDIDAVGLDVSAEMVDFGRCESPDIRFICGDAVQLPFEDGGFDAALFECVLSCVGDPEKALANVRKRMAPAGRLIISDVYAKKSSVPVWTKNELSDIVLNAGFAIDVEEDHTPALVTYAAEHGGKGCSGYGYTLMITRGRV